MFFIFTLPASQKNVEIENGVNADEEEKKQVLKISGDYKWFQAMYLANLKEFIKTEDSKVNSVRCLDNKSGAKSGYAPIFDAKDLKGISLKKILLEFLVDKLLEE